MSLSLRVATQSPSSMYFEIVRPISHTNRNTSVQLTAFFFVFVFFFKQLTALRRETHYVYDSPPPWPEKTKEAPCASLVPSESRTCRARDLPRG